MRQGLGELCACVIRRRAWENVLVINITGKAKPSKGHCINLCTKDGQSTLHQWWFKNCSNCELITLL